LAQVACATPKAGVEAMRKRTIPGRPKSDTEEPMQVGLVPGDAPIGAHQQEETPMTPTAESTRVRNSTFPAPSTPETLTLQPAPCRAWPVRNASQGGMPAEEETEMQKIFGGEARFDGSNRHHTSGDVPHADHNRPLSSISTSAGPTPSPDGRTSPNFTPVPENKANQAQHRKVFVGGIPQDMTQEELQRVVSHAADNAPVKKAWLQKYREQPKTKSQTSHNHRGFGFVIFHDSSAITRLLGDKEQKYIPLENGGRIEVKRAISSSDMPSNVGRPRDTAPPGGRGYQTIAGQSMVGSCPRDAGMGARGQAWQPPAVQQPCVMGASKWPTTGGGGEGMQGMPNQQIQPFFHVAPQQQMVLQPVQNVMPQQAPFMQHMPPPVYGPGGACWQQVPNFGTAGHIGVPQVQAWYQQPMPMPAPVPVQHQPIVAPWHTEGRGQHELS